MNFGYEDYEEEEYESSKLDFLRDILDKINKKNIIITIVSLLIIIFLINFFSTDSRYGRIENKMVKAAQKYVKDNYINVNHEVYLDAKTINFNIDSKCSNISGVFYNGSDYIPYLYCKKYESSIVDNNAKTIKLNGRSVIILVKGSYFVDPLYTSNGQVNIIGEVGNEAGVYNLHYYDVSDNSVVARKVVILDDENLINDVPSIFLNGNDVVHVYKGEQYNEEGVIATDHNDGVITDNVVVSGKVDSNKYGQYLLVYSITNKMGLTNSVSRMVNVVDKDMTLKVDYLVSPLTVVNTSVNISLKITGNDFDYVLLPNNTKDTNSYINYKVEKNGTYVFSVYDRAGRVIKKEVKITNIDKDLPLATCDAVIQNTYTNIVVTPLSLKNISSYEYKVNGIIQKSISSTYHYDGIVSSASVTLNNTSGNKNVIDCNITDYNTWKTDYSKSIVFIKSDTSNDILKKYTLSDYMMGVLYKELIDVDFSSFTNDQLKNLFKTYFILKKAEVLKNGGYSINLKQLVFSVDNSNYCDINGCKLVSKNNKTFYVSNDIEYSVNSTISTKDKLSDGIISIMKSAYNETEKDIIISASFKQVLTNYTENFVLDSSMKTVIIDEIKNNNTYLNIINNNFRNYQIYNINYYSNQYVETRKTYYWPIGSTYATNGMYGGPPESVSVIHNYGASIADNKIYDYLAIRGDCDKTNVISAWNGIVTMVDSNSEYGNYVVVDYSNGVKFVYGSLSKGSISVSVGTMVKRGDLIGKVGKTGNNCMLYLKAMYNDVVTDPGDYISSDDTRPATGDSIIYVPADTVKQSVCLTLLASGFSNSATTALMANMHHESAFNIQTLGDNGTSYGLLQWHGERWTNMKNHCGGRIDTVECQLDFLLYELNNNKKSSKEYIYGNYSTYDATYWFCRKFLMPANAETGCKKRAETALNKYESYVNNGCQ